MDLKIVLTWAGLASVAGMVWIMSQKRPPKPIWPSILFANIACLIWIIGEAAGDFTFDNPSGRWAALVVLYTGVLALPPLWWLFALRYSEAQGHPVRWAGPVVSYGPAALATLLWIVMFTNPWHGQFITVTPGVRVGHRFAWYVQALSGYCAICGVMILFLTLRSRETRREFRDQTRTMIFASSVPLICNLLYVTDTIKYDFTASGFLFGLILFFVGIYRNHLFALSPITLQHLIRHERDGMLIVDRTGRLLHANPAAIQLLGSEACMPFADTIRSIAARLKSPADDGPTIVPDEFLEELISSQPASNARTYRFDHPSVPWLRIETTIIPGRRGKISGVGLRLCDVSQHMKTNEALRESEDRYRELVDKSQGLICVHDMTGKLLMVNPSAARLLGYAPEEMVGRPLADFVVPETVPLIPMYLERIHRDGTTTDTLTVLTRDGQQRIWEYHNFCYRGGGEAYVIGHALDITSRLKAERDLRDSEERYRLIFEGSTEGILFIGADTRPDVVNPRLANILGYTLPELRNVEPMSFVHPDDRSLMSENNRRRLAGENFDRTYEFRALHKDGHIVDVEGTFDVIKRDGVVIGICGIIRDISERRRAEEERSNLRAQLLHAQKLESLGLLAGGIAHDFNNLLTAIMGNARLVIQELSPTTKVYSYASDIELASRRAAELTRQMLAYAGKGPFFVQPVRISDVVNELMKLLQVSISKKCSLVCNIQNDLPMIEGDISQIRQVLMNLIMNASEAIGDNTGEIIVSIGSMHCDREFLAKGYVDNDLPDGEYVFVEVRDTGCGITPEAYSRLFDPFFSTKFTGRGLGLAAVMGIVLSHGGAIMVSSKPGNGASFKVFLPVVDIDAIAIKGAYAPEPAPPKGSGTVFVVDDEEVVRNVAINSLESAGFRTLTAVDGIDALEVFRAHLHEIDVVLLDLTMPRMDGREVLREIRKLQPNAKVILTSGYTKEYTKGRIEDVGLAGFLDKPYQPGDLIEIVTSIIQAKPKSENTTEPKIG